VAQNPFRSGERNWPGFCTCWHLTDDLYPAILTVVKIVRIFWAGDNLTNFCEPLSHEGGFHYRNIEKDIRGVDAVGSERVGEFVSVNISADRGLFV
jgi:hypothetical protein